MPDLPNTPVPDELAAVRAKIRQLQDREGELKRLLLKHPDLREGATWLAEIQETTQARCDIGALRQMYPDIVAEHTHDLKSERVVLSLITEDGEIVKPSRQDRAFWAGYAQGKKEQSA